MVEDVYRLYDRRCKCSTALAKLQKLRKRLKRFKWLSEVLKKLESSVVERSLVFLATGHSEAGIEFYSWDFDYDEKKGFGFCTGSDD